MPGLWADTECKREDLSERCWQATTRSRQAFEQLGFTECGFQKIKNNLNPISRDTGGIRYLNNPGRDHFGQLFYHRARSRGPGAVERELVVIAFTAVFEQGSVSYTNNHLGFDPPSNHTVIRLASNDANVIYQEFLAHLRKCQSPPRRFPDLNSIREWFDVRQREVFEERVRRRLFIRMSDDEVETARKRYLQAIDKPHRPLPAFKIYPGLWVPIAFAVLVLLFLRYHHLAGTNTIDYQGQQFKMSRAYLSYEDYKDDPNNLDTNELDRIEQAMEGAEVPASFHSRKEFIDAIFDVKFPGYGLGGIGEAAKTDDGSTLEVASVEIPQRDKDRFFVVREAGGQLNLVDDFVYGTATNTIQHVKLEKGRLYYLNGQGVVVRETALTK
jgi:hypothetical protein